MKKKVLLAIAVLLMFTVVGISYNNITVNAASDENSNTVVMDKPPFDYYASDKVNNKKSKPIKLNIKTCKPNKIIDDEKWFKNNKLSMNTYEVPNPFQNSPGNLPKGIDKKLNHLIITEAIYDDSYIYCTYGGNFSEGYVLNILDTKTLKILYSIDFTKYRYSPKYIAADYGFIEQKINWAVMKDNILYVSHAHDTYAKSSKNMNAYITAIDLSDMSILWRSKSLVCNSNDFVIVNDVIICGYGFTDEPDYLYQIDRNNGKIINKMKLKTSPEYIMKKGNALFVRTYNTNYKFDIK